MADLPDELLHVNDDKAPMLEGTWQDAAKEDIAGLLNRGETNVAKKVISSLEKILILQALAYTKGRRQEAAKILGLGRNTLTRKIKELGV